MSRRPPKTPLSPRYQAVLARAGHHAPPRRRRATQNDRLLAALKSGREITRDFAHRKLRICNLWQRVRELKALGHAIDIRYELIGPNCKIAVYSMTAADLAADSAGKEDASHE